MRHTASTIIVKNDSLYKAISNHCQNVLYPKLSHTVRERFKHETPCFMAIEDLPNGNMVNIDYIEPEVCLVENRTCFQFTHSRDNNLSVQIFEPASPSELQIRLSNGNVLKTTLIIPPADLYKVRAYPNFY